MFIFDLLNFNKNNENNTSSEENKENKKTDIKTLLIKVGVGVLLFIIIISILRSCMKPKPVEPLPEKDKVNNIHVGEDGDSFSVNGNNILDVNEYFYSTEAGNIMITPKAWKKIGVDKEEVKENPNLLDRFILKEGLTVVTLQSIPADNMADSVATNVKNDIYNTITEAIHPDKNTSLISEGEQAAFLQFCQDYLNRYIEDGKTKTIGNAKNVDDNSDVNVQNMTFIVKADKEHNTDDTTINTGFKTEYKSDTGNEYINVLFEEVTPENLKLYTEDNIYTSANTETATEGTVSDNSVSDNSVSDNSVSDNEVQDNENSESPEETEESIDELTEISEDTEENIINDTDLKNTENIEDDGENDGITLMELNPEKDYSKYFDTSVFNSSTLKVAASSQEECDKFMSKAGVLTRLINRYKSFTDDSDKKAASLAMSLKENVVWPEITIGSKVFITNTPVGTFSVKLPSNYTLDAGHSGNILVMSDVTAKKNFIKPVLKDMDGFDYISDNPSYFYDEFKTVETEAGLEYQTESETTAIDHGFIKEYRAVFETGIEKDKVTGNSVTYILGYYLDINGHGFVVKIPNTTANGESEDKEKIIEKPDDNTAQAVKSLLLSITVNDTGTTNVSTPDNSTDTIDDSTPSSEEIPEEELNVDYDDAILTLIDKEKNNGVSSTLDADDMLKMVAKDSITSKTEKYGDIYNQALYLMRAMGSPKSFTYYEYLSDESDGIKHIQIPAKAGTYKPAYVFYCMDGASYNINGYLISAGSYNDKYSVKNTNTPGKSFDDPLVESKNGNTLYTFYVHDKDGTIVGQCMYEK